MTVLKYAVCCFGIASFAQTGITGMASIQLIDGGTTCNSNTRVVEVWADIQGLSGLGGVAGLNAFVLNLNIDHPELFASVQPGPPMGFLPWKVRGKDKGLVILNNELMVVGWVSDIDAPNDVIHLSNIYLSGPAMAVTLQLIPSNCSLGSRVIAGDGPGPIPIDPISAALTVQVPTWSLMNAEALPAWRSNDLNYDLHPIDGQVDIRDLVLFESCNPQ